MIPVDNKTVILPFLELAAGLVLRPLVGPAALGATPLIQPFSLAVLYVINLVLSSCINCVGLFWKHEYY